MLFTFLFSKETVMKKLLAVFALFLFTAGIASAAAISGSGYGVNVKGTTTRTESGTIVNTTDAREATMVNTGSGNQSAGNVSVSGGAKSGTIVNTTDMRDTTMVNTGTGDQSLGNVTVGQ
jgi:hypothetical protein